jgi:hypothetical protein
MFIYKEFIINNEIEEYLVGIILNIALINQYVIVVSGRVNICS